jgi:sensor domain CHASE-containing protein
MLSAAGLLTKILVAAGLVAAALATYGVWHHKVYQSGVDDAVAKIARADAKLVNRAIEARRKLKDCQSQDKAWDQTTGACR